MSKIQRLNLDPYYREHRKVSNRHCSITNYTDAEKYEAVCLYRVAGVPISVLCEKYHVTKRAFYNWISKFAEEMAYLRKPAPSNVQQTNPMLMSRKRAIPSETPDAELIRLRQENKRLEEALKMAEWMNHAKDVMIDEAEKTFNIPIRKKSGAKQ